MSRSLLIILAVLTAPAPAAAQGPAIPLDVFLEQRVAEELAIDGTVLSRLGVALDVEVVGDRVIVSLVDPGTRRAVASTKLDAVPADREAAVASVTQVAAGLAAQLSTNTSHTTAAVRSLLDHEREDRRAREEAEYSYKQQALSFGNELAVAADGSVTRVSRRWVAYQGDTHKRLDGEDFYRVVGRPDLAAGYRSRRNLGIGLSIAGFAIAVGSMAYGFASAIGSDDCEIGDPNFDACFEAKGDAFKRAVAIGLIGGAAGIGVGIAGVYYIAYAHPISEGEANDLGRAYNTELRKKFGLPTGNGSAVRDVRIAPYAVASGGGLVLGGRF